MREGQMPPHGPPSILPVYSLPHCRESHGYLSPYLFVWPQCRFQKKACVRENMGSEHASTFPQLSGGKHPQKTQLGLRAIPLSAPWYLLAPVPCPFPTSAPQTVQERGDKWLSTSRGAGLRVVGMGQVLHGYVAPWGLT